VLLALAGEHLPELPQLGFGYRPAHPAALAGEEALAEALAAATSEELARRQALVGPHRDRVELSWDGADARQGASAGERKALGLLLVAALAKRLAAAGREPALLLDDVDAELDRDRLARLTRVFEAFPRRWLTSHRASAWEGIGGLTRVVVEASSGPLPTPSPEGS